MDIAQRMVQKYEERFREHGDSHLALGWPDPEKVLTRYRVMLDLIRFKKLERISLLDFGCGLGHFYDYIQPTILSRWIDYSGYDPSQVFIGECREKYPHLNFYDDETTIITNYDYVVMNGLFTERLDVDWWEFWTHAQATIKRAWQLTDKALAVNFMSTHLDYERSDLFHLPFNTLAEFLHHNLSREFCIRHDYGLWEYTAYVRREAI